MKQIDIVEIRDAGELMRMVLGDRNRTALKEIKLVVSHEAKVQCDIAINAYAAKNGFNDIHSIRAPIVKSDRPSPTSIIFPGGLKVTFIEYVQEPDTIPSP
jgi:hypothetical protein